MRKKIRKIVMLISVVSLVIVFLPSCGCNSQTSELEQCFLIGNTMNVKPADKTIISEALRKLEINHNSFAVIVLDGNPDSIAFEKQMQYDHPLFDAKEYDKSIISQETKHIIDAKAQDEEIDILKGLSSCSKLLSKSNSNNKELYVFSSGISTTGSLNFAQNPDWINENPEEIIHILENNHSLPDLSGLTIKWYGFGDVADQQEALSDLNIFRLKNIWNAILKACNADNADSIIDNSIRHDTDISETDKKDYPKVSTVSFDEYININEKDIGFIKDEAIFENEENAICFLEYHAKCIKNIGHTFYIIGMTATADTIEKCFDCAQKRVTAVKTILCNKYGISSLLLKEYPLGQINLGGKYEWRYQDLDEKGKLISSIAQKNRRVIIVDAESDLGKSFINEWEKDDQLSSLH